MNIIEILTLYPKIGIVAIAFIITLIMTLVTKKFTNQQRIKELKEIQKTCRIRLKNAKGNNQEMAKINQQIMECSIELMKHSFKPLFITLIPVLILFWWIKGVYTELLPGWFWWYLGSGIVSSIVLRKVLKVA